VLVARRADVAAERVRERPSLHLAVGDGGGFDPPAGVDDGLLDRSSLRRDEEGVAPVEVEVGLAERESRDPLHPRARLHQQLDLLVDRDREGVLLDLGRPRVSDRLGLGQPNRVHGQPGCGAGHLDRQQGGALNLLVLDPGGGRESPVALHQGPDADTGGTRSVDPLRDLVADDQGFGLLGHGPGVGVTRAGPSGDVDDLTNDFAYRFLSWVATGERRDYRTCALAMVFTNEVTTETRATDFRRRSTGASYRRSGRERSA